MSGALVLIDEENASNSSSVSLTGISSTYDVYVCYLRGVVTYCWCLIFLMRNKPLVENCW